MSQLLQEYVDSRGVAVSVDRASGVLRGVKLIGLASRNGRRYEESALTEAAALYEESKVNVNHPKEGPLAPRDYQDRLGVIRGVEMRPGQGLYGDLHFNPKHALAEQLLWDAEHNPQNVGFSHNVLARLKRDGETTVVEEITKVQSVDLVADPATTRGLFEQADGNAEATAEPPVWDALTVETLRLHRPDLLQEYQTAAVQQLQEQVEQAESRSTSLEKRQQIVELLCEYRLPIPRADSAEESDQRQSVSALFIEWLMAIPNEADIEALIAERAELMGRVAPWGCSSPRSRDQISVLGLQSDAILNSRDFAEALKSSRN